jgi:hypothetical protein
MDKGSTVFQIKASANTNVNDLKELVWEKKKNRLSGIDLSDLLLSKVSPLSWCPPTLSLQVTHNLQVTKPIQVKPAPTLFERLQSLDDDATTVELDPTDKVSDLFPRRPTENHLHIFVTLPSNGDKKRLGWARLPC